MKGALEISPLLPKFGGTLQEDAHSFITKLDFYYRKLGVGDELFLDAVTANVSGLAALWFV